MEGIGAAGRRRWLPGLLWPALVGAAYFAAATVALGLVSQPDGVAVLWPAAGVAAGALIAAPAALRAWVAAAVLVAVAAANRAAGVPWDATAVFALANTGEAALCALAYHRLTAGSSTLAAPADALRLGLAAAGACAAAALAGLAGLAAVGSAGFSAQGWFSWFAGDVTGVMTLAPLFLARPAPGALRAEPWEALASILAVLGSGLAAWFVVFAPRVQSGVLGDSPLVSLLPAILLVGVRFRAPTAAWAGAAVAAVFVAAAVGGVGLFGPGDRLSDPVASAQVLTLAVSLSMLALSLIFEERRRQAELIDQSHDAIFTWEPGGGIASWNRGAEALYGFPRREALGRAVHDLLRPEEAGRVTEAERGLVRSGAWTGELTHRTKDGRRLFVESRQVLVGGGRLVLQTDRDVTTRKEAEAARWRSEEELRAVFDLAGVGIAQADPATHRFLRVNPRLAQITGYAQDELLGMHVHALNHPDDAPIDAASFRRLLATGEPFVAEKRYRRKDGGTAWVRVNVTLVRDGGGAPARTVAVVEDVSAARAAADAMRASEESFRTLADAIPTLCWFADPDGSITWYNRRWYDYTGTTPEQMTGWGWRSVHDPEALPQVMERWSRSIATGERFEMVFPLKGADGLFRPFLTRIEPLRGEDGRVVRWFGTNTDITEQKRAEEELSRRVAEVVAEREAALAQVHQMQKMEVIGQLTGGVAHDFNNLLTPIVGVLDMLQRRVAGDPRAERQVDAALQAADRARLLVQRLLSFARRQMLETRAVDVAALVGGMSDLVVRTIGPQVKVSVDLPSGLPPASVDPNQLELALLNLAVNARDAMPGGGALTIVARHLSVGPERPEGLEPGDYVRLSVVDTGVGMDEATLARCVEPFFSTKGLGKGTGLGLSMVHGLAAQSGGKLVVTSAPGVGTRADVWLPVAAGTAAEEPAAPEPARPARPAVVLLVDDDALAREATAEMLRDLGHEVVEAEGSAEALGRLRAGLAPDLLITDRLMRGMDGAELARAARAVRPGLAALVVTGQGGATDAGEEPVLPKPFRQADLAEAVAEALGQGKVVRLPTRGRS